MRLALSGAHATGKSTLVEELRRRLPGYVAVEEPYYALLDRGHSFADPPSAEDFELQLETSIESLAAASGRDVLFERCPADYLAYLSALEPLWRNEWSDRVADAMARLELVVFVPIERQDRINVRHGGGRLRRRVDELLRAMLLSDEWGFSVRAIEVTGAPGDRARQVLAHLR